eukprot:3828511-Pleurochrysis_carterae.AAC.3
MRARGARVVTIDTAVGGADHDLARYEVAETVLGWVRAGRFDAVFAAPPCASFSVALHPPVRTREQPTGISPAPSGWAHYVRKHNKLADFTGRLLREAQGAGACWMVENPADCGDPSSEAWWPRFSTHAPL